MVPRALSNDIELSSSSFIILCRNHQERGLIRGKPTEAYTGPQRVASIGHPPLVFEESRCSKTTNIWRLQSFFVGSNKRTFFRVESGPRGKCILEPSNDLVRPQIGLEKRGKTLPTIFLEENEGKGGEDEDDERGNTIGEEVRSWAGVQAEGGVVA